MSFVWCASAQALATQMSHTPCSVPPVKKCPKDALGNICVCCLSCPIVAR